MAKTAMREFKGYTNKTIDFFVGIRLNNNKAWFEEHKQDYLDFCLKPTRELVHDLVPAMLKIDPHFQTDPKKIISRIYRDIRFSKDKTPYKTRIWFSFKRPGDGWQDAPGYYFEIAYDSYGFGMGMYDPASETMARFRKKITSKPAEFLKAISFLKAKDNIFSVGGESYKKPPKVHVDEKLLKWYMMKNFYFYCDRPLDKILAGPKLVDELEKDFKILAPFYKYLWRLK